MNRTAYFKKINSVSSPLLLLPADLDSVVKIRANDMLESKTVYLDFADKLSQFQNEAAKTRATFIRMQCDGKEAGYFFEQHRESWGIPKFEEDLLRVNEFKNGFLFTFRDHSTSWCEDAEARDWFFKSVEARFARNYEFWACDNGPEEIVSSTSGDYKTMMWTIVRDYQNYSALASSVFTKQDLKDFYNNFDEEDGDYYKEDLLEMIEENPNW
ncbi:hypothetical protein WBG78_23240 [Chryseolinea sp. T2]|uniref:hypothetical protein n=1 Tax=Chryseolinea sp. T2 TaxID=3129255 RepID=UPI003076D92F